MAAANELAARLPADEVGRFRPPPDMTPDVLGLLNEADRALSEGRTREATIYLLRCHVTTPQVWPEAAWGRWESIADRLLEALEAETWTGANSG